MIISLGLYFVKYVCKLMGIRHHVGRGLGGSPQSIGSLGRLFDMELAIGRSNRQEITAGAKLDRDTIVRDSAHFQMRFVRGCDGAMFDLL